MSPAGELLGGREPGILARRRRAWLQNGRAQPVAGQKREFHVLAVVGDGVAEALLGLADPVLDGVLMQDKALRRGLVAAAAAQEDQQRLAQPRVMLVIAGQARERAADPGAQQVA